MLRNLACLYLCISCYLFTNSYNLYAQNFKQIAGNTKFTFSLNHKNIQQDVLVDQLLLAPTYKVTLDHSPSEKECVSVQCNNILFKKTISRNQTWGGLFGDNQKFNSWLDPAEVAYLLSENIKGIDLVLANIITSKSLLKNIKLKQRPKTWSDFENFVKKLQDELNKIGISYNLYNEIINVNGYENSIKLDYFSEQYCVKRVYFCKADSLDARKEITDLVQKNVTIQYSKPTTNSSVFLYDHEVDTFEIIVNSLTSEPEIINHNKHNTYLVHKDKSSTEHDIIINIIPLKRNLVPLNNHVMFLVSESYMNGLFFEWRLSSDQFNSMLLAEKDTITIDYELCEIYITFCVHKIRKNRFNLSSVNLPLKTNKKELLLKRLTLDKSELKNNKTYQMTYKIHVKGTSRIAAPIVFKNKVRIQYQPYSL